MVTRFNIRISNNNHIHETSIIFSIIVSIIACEYNTANSPAWLYRDNEWLFLCLVLPFLCSPELPEHVDQPCSSARPVILLWRYGIKEQGGGMKGGVTPNPKQASRSCMSIMECNTDRWRVYQA